MKLSADKKNVRIDIAESLDAVAIENLIADLAALRVQMGPEVPLGVQEVLQADRPRNVSVVEDPFLEVRELKDRRLRLWLRHGGLGWMAFNLPREKALVLRDYLVQIIPTSESSSLIGGDESGGQTAH